ncbi:MAG: amidase family protein [Candidatus Marinimicrobia bacterium]|nr:amidase family protein [Candidatus Neomarinimicrobiota bacterium]
MKSTRTTLQFVFFLLLSFILFASCKPASNNISANPYNDFPFLEYEIRQFREAFDSGALSVQELTRAYLERIEAIDDRGPRLNSMIRVNPDAMEIAGQLDREKAQGLSRGPLHGIPVVLKDNIDTHDRMPATAGSAGVKGFLSPSGQFHRRKAPGGRGAHSWEGEFK